MDGHAEPLPEQPARHGVAGGVDLGGAGALRRRRMRRILFAVALPLMALVTVSAAAQETPRHGGELVLVVPAEPPSYDAHREGTFALRLRRGVRFHDGTELTSRDAKASFDKVVFPPLGVASNRKGIYVNVEAVEAPDPWTVVFRLKWPQGSDRKS